MGRYVDGVNNSWKWKYWLAEQPSELGEVLNEGKGEIGECPTTWIYRGEDGEIIRMEISLELKEWFERILTQEMQDYTKKMLQSLQRFIDQDYVWDSGELLEFYSEY